jgi:hypothetical protein
MSKIKLLDQLLTKYKIWTLKLKGVVEDVENNILQKDSSNKLQEKLVSIATSSILVFLVTSVIGLFGVALGGAWMVVFFVIGWLLSRFINKIVFGSERKVEDLKDHEVQLLELLKSVQKSHESIRNNINNKTLVVNFTNYVELKKEFGKAVEALVDFDVSKLALKYRYKHPLIVKKYKVQVNRFEEIYANKKGRF